ncbi:hypothetical protein AAMO2058_000908200 [Amorphochlora amoebiformis]
MNGSRIVPHASIHQDMEAMTALIAIATPRVQLDKSPPISRQNTTTAKDVALGPTEPVKPSSIGQTHNPLRHPTRVEEIMIGVGFIICLGFLVLLGRCIPSKFEGLIQRESMLCSSCYANKASLQRTSIEDYKPLNIPDTHTYPEEDQEESQENKFFLKGGSIDEGPTRSSPEVYQVIPYTKIVGAPPKPRGKKYTILVLKIATFSVLAYAVALACGGIAANSLLMQTEAVHMITDAIAFGMSWKVESVSDSEMSANYPYGRTRLGVLGGFLQACFLFALAITLSAEAVSHYLRSETISEPFVLIYTGIGGLILTSALAVMLSCVGPSESTSHGHSHALRTEGASSTLNVFGALLHAIADGFDSVVIIGTGLVAVYTSFRQMDPLATLLVIGFQLSTSIPLGLHCAKLLLETPPNKLNVESICEEIKMATNSQDLRLRIWRITDAELAATAKIRVRSEDMILAISAANTARKILFKNGVEDSVVEITDKEIQCCCCPLDTKEVRNRTNTNSSTKNSDSYKPKSMPQSVSASDIYCGPGEADDDKVSNADADFGRLLDNYKKQTIKHLREQAKLVAEEEEI